MLQVPFSCCSLLSVEKIAQARGISMAQVSLAWLLSKDVVSAPIIGTTSLQNLEQLIGQITAAF
jgi:aryl-alcohol dehydrogenase-like predicted oxidoreductase